MTSTRVASAVVKAWSRWRESPEWPSPGHPYGPTNRERDHLVTEVSSLLEDMPTDADLNSVATLSRRLITVGWAPPGDHLVDHAVTELRHAAVNRPSLVHEARNVLPLGD
jgi:hypothetical protein